MTKYTKQTNEIPHSYNLTLIMTEQKYIDLDNAHKEVTAALKKLISIRKEYDWEVEDYMLSDLLLSHNVFINGDELLVNCNDVFAWALADAEPFKLSELEEVYNASINGIHGLTKWVCKKRNSKPQKPLIDRIKKSGEWDDEFENMGENMFGE